MGDREERGEGDGDTVREATGRTTRVWDCEGEADCLERHGQRRMEGDAEGPTKQVIESGEGKESGMGKGTPQQGTDRH